MILLVFDLLSPSLSSYASSSSLNPSPNLPKEKKKESLQAKPLNQGGRKKIKTLFLPSSLKQTQTQTQTPQQHSHPNQFPPPPPHLFPHLIFPFYVGNQSTFTQKINLCHKSFLSQSSTNLPTGLFLFSPSIPLFSEFFLSFFFLTLFSPPPPPQKGSSRILASFINYFIYILFYFILFYFILFYFILFYFILFYFILFYFILFYLFSFLFFSFLFFSFLFFSFLFFSFLFFSFLFFSFLFFSFLFLLKPTLPSHHCLFSLPFLICEKGFSPINVKVPKKEKQKGKQKKKRKKYQKEKENQKKKVELKEKKGQEMKKKMK